MSKEIDIEYYHQLALQKQKEHRKVLANLKKKPPKNLDKIAQQIHQEVFEEIDCTACANCCKTLGPDFKEADITRIAKYFKMKLPAFEAEFLQVDEDGDKVFKSMPCPFLGGDNLCSIYDVRPKACREFPHTDRKKIHQINHLTIKNTLTCPAAYLFVEKLKDKLQGFVTLNLVHKLQDKKFSSFRTSDYTLGAITQRVFELIEYFSNENSIPKVSISVHEGQAQVPTLSVALSVTMIGL